MITLKEEIKAICQGLNYEVTLDSCDEEADQILKLFEKLIDEKIKVIETLGDKYSFNHDSIIRTLQELKEQLKRK